MPPHSLLRRLCQQASSLRVPGRPTSLASAPLAFVCIWKGHTPSVRITHAAVAEAEAMAGLRKDLGTGGGGWGEHLSSVHANAGSGAEAQLLRLLQPLQLGRHRRGRYPVRRRTPSSIRHLASSGSGCIEARMPPASCTGPPLGPESGCPAISQSQTPGATRRCGPASDSCTPAVPAKVPPQVHAGEMCSVASTIRVRRWRRTVHDRQ